MPSRSCSWRLAAAERDAAAGDDRAWMEQIALLADALPVATDGLEVFVVLADMAAEAGWLEESSAMWRRGAKVKPDDVRPPLGLALLAARKWNVDEARASAASSAAAAAAAAEVAKLDGAETPRSQVAAGRGTSGRGTGRRAGDGHHAVGPPSDAGQGGSLAAECLATTRRGRQ